MVAEDVPGLIPVAADLALNHVVLVGVGLDLINGADVVAEDVPGLVPVAADLALNHLLPAEVGLIHIGVKLRADGVERQVGIIVLVGNKELGAFPILIQVGVCLGAMHQDGAALAHLGGDGLLVLGVGVHDDGDGSLVPGKQGIRQLLGDLIGLGILHPHGLGKQAAGAIGELHNDGNGFYLKAVLLHHIDVAKAQQLGVFVALLIEHFLKDGEYFFVVNVGFNDHLAVVVGVAVQEQLPIIPSVGQGGGGVLVHGIVQEDGQEGEFPIVVEAEYLPVPGDGNRCFGFRDHQLPIRVVIGACDAVIGSEDVVLIGDSLGVLQNGIQQVGLCQLVQQRRFLGQCAHRKCAEHHCGEQECSQSFDHVHLSCHLVLRVVFPAAALRLPRRLTRSPMYFTGLSGEPAAPIPNSVRRHNNPKPLAEHRISGSCTMRHMTTWRRCSWYIRSKWSHTARWHRR